MFFPPSSLRQSVDRLRLKKQSGFSCKEVFVIFESEIIVRNIWIVGARRIECQRRLTSIKWQMFRKNPDCSTALPFTSHGRHNRESTIEIYTIERHSDLLRGAFEGNFLSYKRR